MEQTDPNIILRQRLFTLTLIWASMTISVGAYILALYLLDLNSALPFAPVDESESTIKMALLLMAATAGASTFTLPGMLLKPHALRNRLRATDTDPMNLDLVRLGTVLFPQYQVVGIIRWATAEAVGMMGLIMGLLYGLGLPVYGLLIVSAASLVATKPSREELDRLATSVRGM